MKTADNVGTKIKPRRRTHAERRAASTQAILDAALICFNKNGFQVTSMGEIAREAGVSKGLLHYHFESKEHLFLEVVTMLFTRVAEKVQKTTLKAGPSADQAMWALDELWALLTAARPLMPILMDLGARALTNEKLKPLMVENFEKHRNLVLEGLRTVLGPLRDKLALNESDLTEIVIATVTGLSISAILSADPKRADSGFQAFKKFLLQNILPQSFTTPA